MIHGKLCQRVKLGHAAQKCKPEARINYFKIWNSNGSVNIITSRPVNVNNKETFQFMEAVVIVNQSNIKG